MGYSRENYRKIKEQYKEKRLRAQQLAESRREEIEQRIPEIAKIDRALAETAINILKETTAGKVGLDARLARLKKENEELQTIRGDILAHHGYPCLLYTSNRSARDGKNCTRRARHSFGRR